MQDYLQNLSQKFARTDVAKGREMIYRTDFENLLKDIFQADGKVTQINHDATSDNGNKPDFAISKNGVPILYIEAKDIGVSLDKIEKSNQMDRYFGYDNLVLTDYLEFRFYRNGVKYGQTINIAKHNDQDRIITPIPENFELLKRTLLDFSTTHKESIKSGLHLAKIMGGKAQRIRDNLLLMIEKNYPGSEELLKMENVIKETLISEIDDKDFADMYSQTLVYGLFAARYNDLTPDTFTRSEARDLVPKTNPFLRSFFDHIAGSSFPQTLAFIVDELCEIFTHADIGKLLQDFYKKEKDDKDPIIHFYEDFLKEYDSTKKMEMGVFYTPKQVVQFIVRSVDEVLKKDFGINKGLTDSSKVEIKEKTKNTLGKEIINKKEFHKVQILDVATGTGTFLNETVNHIHKDFESQQGRWPSYVQNDLLPRLHGFELMMASYTIAHLKLGITLHDSGSTDQENRLGIYLTNTLDEPVDYTHQGTLFGFMDSVAEESQLASKVKKEYPIMCVIGNPPYSGISQNNHYTDNDVYKVEPGGKQKLQERKHWLNDDYVKFIRFAESLIEKNGEGVVGMITAHGYIDNPTFRGMRWHLRKTFDKIYVVDLHGNSNKKETAPDGSKDENVFDIKTGVSIIIGVRNSPLEGCPKGGVDSLAKIYKKDLFGLRKDKFEFLEKMHLSEIDWVEIPDDNDSWIIESKHKKEYEKGFSVAELFPKNTTGIVTMGDSFIIDEDKEKLSKRVDEFLYNDISEMDLKKKYDLGKNYAKWIIDNKKKIQNDNSKLVKFAYRPFDTRWTYFDNNLVWRPRTDTMKHFFNRENVGLVVSRINRGVSQGYVFISKVITDFHILDNAQDSTSLFPLYLYTDFGDKIPNLKKEIVEKFEDILGAKLDWGNSPLEGCPQDGVDIKTQTNSTSPTFVGTPQRGECLKPEDILDYIYAVLHSPSYRSKYKELLKTDFPRVPYPKSKEDFWRLVPLGTKLRNLHLMTDPICEKFITTFPIAGTDEVESVKWVTKNSPLEGCPKGGVDSSPPWKQKSLFPFWNLPKNKNLESNAKELRKAGVLSEVLFWQAFKEKNYLGYDIDRQYIIGDYIVDFFISELGLVVEIDGESHDFKGEYDQKREEYLKSLGLEIIHYQDLEIKKSMDFVADSFQSAIKKREVELREKSTPSDLQSATPQEGNFGRVQINETQYFGNVPETAWNFYIGGYQPAQKYLKDRKGRKLTNEEIEQYQRIIVVLTETAGVMGKVG